MSGRRRVEAGDRLVAVADRDDLDVLVGKRQLDDALDGDAVVGEQQGVGTVRLSAMGAWNFTLSDALI